MSLDVATATWNWLRTGDQVFPEMLGAIDAAERSVALETYIFTAERLGERFRDALVRARSRGVEVKVLVDGLGSMRLPTAFWDPLRSAGGEVRVFNPLSLQRLGIRNHRKLLVTDRTTGFIGGFNISSEYEGDGVTCGWCDVGLKIHGPLVEQLAVSFEDMFARADFQHKRFSRLHRSTARKTYHSPREELLLSGPGWGRNPIKRALRRDLGRARDVRIMVAYFLPSWNVRRDLARVVARGGRVQLILAGKSDVMLSQLAGQSLYRRLLRAGVEIYEYQPQILHAKLLIMDDTIQIGSANLDPRSMSINYELMIRLQDPEVAEQAKAIFASAQQHSQRITRDAWRESRSVWRRMKQHWAYFILVRVDPYIAHNQWQALPD